MMAVIKTLILISVIILPMMMMAQDVNPVCYLPLGKEEDEIRRERERVLKIFHEIEREIEQTCSDHRRSCEDVSSPGIYQLNFDSNKFKVYCDVTTQGSHWTLIARFSNRDKKNWMQDDGHWWYDQNVAEGTTTDPSVNADMISPAFWLVSGRELKITRSDDSSHAPLLQTTGNCLGGQTFRSKITSYGVFRYREDWSSYRCLGNCTVKYGGQYETTEGFKQAECNGSLATSNKISFWCHYKSDGSVMMIGSGGKGCERADHGIGITEANHASFEPQGWVGEYDFGNDAEDWYGHPTKHYSLNLWIR